MLHSTRSLLLAVSLVSMAVAAPAAAGSEDPAPLATQRRVHGVITALSDGTLTIATEKGSITGKLDPSRTRVTVKGRPARPTDLELTARARAELCLDDVWVVVATH